MNGCVLLSSTTKFVILLLVSLFRGFLNPNFKNTFPLTTETEPWFDRNDVFPINSQVSLPIITVKSDSCIWPLASFLGPCNTYSGITHLKIQFSFFSPKFGFSCITTQLPTVEYCFLLNLILLSTGVLYSTSVGRSVYVITQVSVGITLSVTVLIVAYHSLTVLSWNHYIQFRKPQNK